MVCNPLKNMECSNVLFLAILESIILGGNLLGMSLTLRVQGEVENVALYFFKKRTLYTTLQIHIY